ncbi:MAG: hypothetical protein NT149_04370 [Candidatus Gottesmanbacteria bacterium]|nr:hypothetical protein [Candidatus Gottesmanbacteria bacterium]
MMKPKRSIFLRKFGKVIGYVVLIVLFSGVVYWFCTKMFTINNIVVVGNNIQVQVDGSRLPKTLLLFPAGKLRAQLLATNPILADIQFQKKYPHTLVIVPTLRSAVARLALVSREVLVDEGAIVLTDTDAASANLPRIVVPITVVRIGEKISDPRVTAGIAFITGMRDILPICSVSVEDEQSLRAKSDKLDILFPQRGSTAAILATLQTLLSGFRIKGTLPTFIDLRFNKPIIKF